jgi:hypothetical protein
LGKNKLTLIGLFVLALLVGGGLLWYFLQPSREDVKPKEKETPVLAEYVASYTEDGKVSLYKVKTGAKVDEVDLKTKTTKTEKIIEVKSFVEPKKQEGKVEPKTEGTLFKGYEMVTKTIQKGETVWHIQSELTPHINTIKMLPLLQEVNKGKSLHPVQPNETRIFLKEPNGQSEVQKEQPKQSPSNEVSNKTVSKKVEDSTFVYYADEKAKTLYAYSNFANEVYKLTVKNDKWSVETIASVNSKHEADWLYVDAKKIWLADDSHTHIQVYDLQHTEKVVEWDTKGKMSKWQIDKDIVTYTYDNRMASEQLGKGVTKDVVLGDVTLDFVKVKDTFYVLNSFGKKTDNSLLMKVNPKDLNVDDLIELKSNQTAILSHGDKGHVYVGRVEKTKGLDGKIIESPKVVSVDVESKSLNEKAMKWDLMFSSDMKGWNDHLYAVTNNKLSIYPTGEKTPVKEFDVNAPQFSLLP